MLVQVHRTPGIQYKELKVTSTRGISRPGSNRIQYKELKGYTFVNSSNTPDCMNTI